MCGCGRRELHVRSDVGFKAERFEARELQNTECGLKRCGLRRAIGRGVECVHGHGLRGNEDDVGRRYYTAARPASAAVLVLYGRLSVPVFEKQTDAATERAYPDEDRCLPVPDVHCGVLVVRDAPRDHIPEYLQVFDRVEPPLGERGLEGDLERVCASNGWVGSPLGYGVRMTFRRASARETVSQQSSVRIIPLIWTTDISGRAGREKTSKSCEMSTASAPMTACPRDFEIAGTIRFSSGA